MKRINLFLVTLLIFFSGLNSICQADNLKQTSSDIKDTKKTLKIFSLKDCITKSIDNSLDIQFAKIDRGNTEIEADKAELFKSRLSSGRKQVNDGKEKLALLMQLSRMISGMNNDFVIPDSYTGGMLPTGTTKAQLNALISEASDSISEGESKVEKNLQNEQVQQLLGLKTQTELDVIDYGIEIGKTQISLLTQNNYYTVLKNKKILALKKATLARIQKQQEIVKNAYSVGMKPKDDLLLCQIQEASAKIAVTKAEMDLNNSIIELKKGMNALNEDFDIKDIDTKTELVQYDINEGITSGLKNRLEIKKANAACLITKTNFEIIKRYDEPYFYEYREAEIKAKEADVNLKKAQLTVETDIREGNETLKKVGQMLIYTDGIYEKAKENLEISKAKYEAGFAFGSANLKDLNLEEASGTLVDVLAAEEKLSTVEESIAELEFNYNLAKAKYLYDIGQLF